MQSSRMLLAIIFVPVKNVGYIMLFCLVTIFFAHWLDHYKEGATLAKKLLTYWHQRIFKQLEMFMTDSKWQDQNQWLAHFSEKEQPSLKLHWCIKILHLPCLLTIFTHWAESRYIFPHFLSVNLALKIFYEWE